MERNALVIFDMQEDDVFLLEAGGDAPDPRALAIMAEILASHGYRVTRAAPSAEDQSGTGAGTRFATTGAALVAALAIFERFAARQFAQSPAVLRRAEAAAAIYRAELLARLPEIDAALPLSSLIRQHENGLTRQELASLGGQGRTAVALRVILSTLPRAIAQLGPGRRAVAVEAFAILSEVWDILADDICALADRPKAAIKPRRA